MFMVELKHYLGTYIKNEFIKTPYNILYGVVQKRYWVATFPGYMQKPFSFYQVFIFLNEIVHKIINPGTVFRYLPYLRTPDFLVYNYLIR